MRFQTALKWFAFVCFCFYPAIASGQESIRQVTVGPNGDRVRIVVALMDPSSDGYKLQSLIVDVTPAKNKTEQPLAVQVDLTSTIRSVKTGKKEQKILVLRWKGTGEPELRCDGKWVRREATSTAVIVETVKAVIGNVPLDARTPIDVTLSPELERRVSAALEGLSASDLPCVKDAH